MQIWQVDSAYSLLICILLINILYVTAISDVQFDISLSSLSTNNFFYTYVDGCPTTSYMIINVFLYFASARDVVGVDFGLFQNVPGNTQFLDFTLFPQQYNGSAHLGSPMNIISIVAKVTMICALSIDNKIDDNTVLLGESNSTLNFTENSVLSGITTNYRWNLTVYLTRRCTSSFDQGFNCDGNCQPTHDQNYCYDCSLNGQRICCNNTSGMNPYTCEYWNSTDYCSTIWPDTSNNENLYFGLMLGFSIFSFILLLIIIIAAGCLLINRNRNEHPKRQKIREVYVVDESEDAYNYPRHHSTRRQIRRLSGSPRESYRRRDVVADSYPDRQYNRQHSRHSQNEYQPDREDRTRNHSGNEHQTRSRHQSYHEEEEDEPTEYIDPVTKRRCLRV